MPLPPPPEQRAIAGALGDVDALIGALDQLIAKKRDLKQAAMQQLLTGQTRLPGFSGEWEVKRLGEIAFSNNGRRSRHRHRELLERAIYPHLDRRQCTVLGYYRRVERLRRRLSLPVRKVTSWEINVHTHGRRFWCMAGTVMRTSNLPAKTYDALTFHALSHFS